MTSYPLSMWSNRYRAKIGKAAFARRLRHWATPSERALWAVLRRLRLGVKSNRDVEAGWAEGLIRVEVDRLARDRASRAYYS
jgi:hypothetical protein